MAKRNIDNYKQDKFDDSNRIKFDKFDIIRDDDPHKHPDILNPTQVFENRLSDNELLQQKNVKSTINLQSQNNDDLFSSVLLPGEGEGIAAGAGKSDENDNVVSGSGGNQGNNLKFVGNADGNSDHFNPNSKDDNEATIDKTLFKSDFAADTKKTDVNKSDKETIITKGNRRINETEPGAGYESAHISMSSMYTKLETKSETEAKNKNEKINQDNDESNYNRQSDAYTESIKQTSTDKNEHTQKIYDSSKTEETGRSDENNNEKSSSVESQNNDKPVGNAVGHSKNNELNAHQEATTSIIEAEMPNAEKITVKLSEKLSQSNNNHETIKADIQDNVSFNPAAGAGKSDENDNLISGTSGNQGNDKFVGNAGGQSNNNELNEHQEANVGIIGSEIPNAEKIKVELSEKLPQSDNKHETIKTDIQDNASFNPAAGAGKSDENNNLISGTSGNQGNDKDIGNAGGYHPLHDGKSEELSDTITSNINEIEEEIKNEIVDTVEVISEIEEVVESDANIETEIKQETENEIVDTVEVISEFEEAVESDESIETEDEQAPENEIADTVEMISEFEESVESDDIIRDKIISDFNCLGSTEESVTTIETVKVIHQEIIIGADNTNEPVDTVSYEKPLKADIEVVETVPAEKEDETETIVEIAQEKSDIDNVDEKLDIEDKKPELEPDIPETIIEQEKEDFIVNPENKSELVEDTSPEKESEEQATEVINEVVDEEIAVAPEPIKDNDHEILDEGEYLIMCPGGYDSCSGGKFERVINIETIEVITTETEIESEPSENKKSDNESELTIELEDSLTTEEKPEQRTPADNKDSSESNSSTEPVIEDIKFDSTITDVQYEEKIDSIDGSDDELDITALMTSDDVLELLSDIDPDVNNNIDNTFNTIKDSNNDTILDDFKEDNHDDDSSTPVNIDISDHKYENNGFGNGDQDAPGGSEFNNNAENAGGNGKGSHPGGKNDNEINEQLSPDFENSLADEDRQDNHHKYENNGFGNGDQNAPGGSEFHNNAENSGGNTSNNTNHPGYKVISHSKNDKNSDEFEIAQLEISGFEFSEISDEDMEPEFNYDEQGVFDDPMGDDYNNEDSLL
ncbi:MAG: hypothetical protein KZQ83_05055 [gamma proteobacterium symbiont of Taylorina sp.]|nr:hypothetical protein [gamma proteobacterium symbiont of Taylorina sp.]